MAEALLRLQRREGLEFKIAREDLAAMAAMATETVSRTLSDFKEEGLVEKKRQHNYHPRPCPVNKNEKLTKIIFHPDHAHSF